MIKATLKNLDSKSKAIATKVKESRKNLIAKLSNETERMEIKQMTDNIIHNLTQKLDSKYQNKFEWLTKKTKYDQKDK